MVYYHFLTMVEVLNLISCNSMPKSCIHVNVLQFESSFAVIGRPGSVNVPAGRISPWQTHRVDLEAGLHMERPG